MVQERFFEIDDVVIYKPSEDCHENSISDDGIVVECLEFGWYKVKFGLRSIYGTRTGKYHWSYLYPSENNITRYK